MSFTIKKLSKYLKYTIVFTKRLKYATFKASPNKRIVVCFDGSFSHGGLVDRFKGIVSYYHLSKMLGYDFHIDFNHPFILTRYLKPNKIRWDLWEKIRWNPFQTKIIISYNDFHINPKDSILSSKARTFYVYSNIDYLQIMEPALSQEEVSKLWADNFHELFDVAPELKILLDRYNKVPFIAIHTRFTTLLGDFNDTTKEILSISNQQKLIESVIDKVKKELPYKENEVIVFSDSNIFVEAIATAMQFTTIEGKPIHMDFSSSKKTSESEHLKTFLDFMLLSCATYVYFIKIGPMYASDFSKYASMVGYKPFKRIL